MTALQTAIMNWAMTVFMVMLVTMFAGVIGFVAFMAIDAMLDSPSRRKRK